MAVSLLFWACLLLPGYVLVRRVSPDDLESGLLGTVALSSFAAFALLSPVSILCYVLRMPVAVFAVAAVIAMVAAVVEILRCGWWRDLGKLLVAGMGVELLILVIDMVMGGRVGAFIAGGDARLHVARIRFMLDHGMSNQDPFIAATCFFPVYHTNLLHALHAACSYVTRVDSMSAWFMNLVWAKLLIASGYYFVAWCAFERRWVAWIVALFAIGWLAPVTFVLYPNQLAPNWLIPVMMGFAVHACRATCPWRVPLKLAIASLLLGQIHSLYAVFAGIALGPVLAGVFLVRLLRRHEHRWRNGACVAALFVAAPFVLISRSGMAPAPRGETAEVEQTNAFYHGETGWVVFKPTFLEGKRGVAVGLLAWIGLGCLLTGSHRKRAGVLLAATGTVAALLFTPPLCAASIEALGREWIVARMVQLLLAGLVVLALGGAAARLEKPLRWWWLRSLISIAVVVLGSQFLDRHAPYDLETYYQTARASARVRHGTLNGMWRLGSFCRRRIPPGETVLTDVHTQKLLVMLHDCRAVSVTNGGGVADAREREADVQLMLVPDTPWETRRDLLRHYGVHLFMVNRRFFPPEAYAWVEGHLERPAWSFGGFLLFPLKLG